MVRPWQLYQAERVIRNDGVIAYPTEAVYGLGIQPESAIAASRLLKIKSRAMNKGLIIIASDLLQVTHYISDKNDIDWSGIMATWPGPVTWVFPVAAGVPDWLTGKRDTIAIRVSAHPFVQSLCDVTGPLVSTSANPSQCPPAKTSNKVRSYFGDKIDLVLSGKLGGLSKPTEIRDARSGDILRAS